MATGVAVASATRLEINGMARVLGRGYPRSQPISGRRRPDQPGFEPATVGEEKPVKKAAAKSKAAKAGTAGKPKRRSAKEELDRTTMKRAPTAPRTDATMNAYVALLRAVNVGGTGKLPMSDLKALCERAGLQRVRTYIASGNVVFASREPEARVKAALETALEAYAGKPVGVLVRTAAEMVGVVAGNPFPDASPSQTVAIFLDESPPRDALERATGRADEEMRLGTREIYVYYGDGMGRSKLKIPAARDGTARNINTVTKLAEMASELG
jgi:uncharacterized protein (DUF1697 family)